MISVFVGNKEAVDFLNRVCGELRGNIRSAVDEEICYSGQEKSTPLPAFSSRSHFSADPAVAIQLGDAPGAACAEKHKIHGIVHHGVSEVHKKIVSIVPVPG
jgi:hypothetical protein